MRHIPWLKLDTSIIDDQKIKIVRKMPAGSDMFLIWIGLLCMAMKGKRPGMVEVDDGIPYSDDDLATAFDMPTPTIQLALATFSRLKMLEVGADGVIQITNFGKHQSLDLIEHKRQMTRARVQKYRENQAKLQLEDKSNGVTRYGVTCNATDLDLDLDKEKEKSKTFLFSEKNKKDPNPTSQQGSSSKRGGLAPRAPKPVLLDPITGLPWRKQTQEELDAEIKKREDERLERARKFEESK